MPAAAMLLLASALALAQPARTPERVDSVDVTGNRAVPSADLIAVIAIKPGTVLAGPQQVKTDIDHIVALYRRRGLDLAVSPDIGHPAPGHVTLRYRIDEHGHGGDAGAAPPPPAGDPR